MKDGILSLCFLEIPSNNIKMNKEREQRRKWTEQEDQRLRQAVQQFTSEGKPRWKQIADHLNQVTFLPYPHSRSLKQCRERWSNIDVEAEGSAPWSVQDDVSLIQACKKYGHRWTKLAGEFQGVNDNRLKNHFYSGIRKFCRHINHLLVQVRRRCQKKAREGCGSALENQSVLMEASKLKSFDSKFFNKVFSLLDSRQEHKYEAQQAVEVHSIQNINTKVLDFLEDFLGGANRFSDIQLLSLLLEVAQINRWFKTKYTRGWKLSVRKDKDLDKAMEKKKEERKVSQLVRKELKNTIIPDKKMKTKLIEKLKLTPRAQNPTWRTRRGLGLGSDGGKNQGGQNEREGQGNNQGEEQGGKKNERSRKNEREEQGKKNEREEQGKKNERRRKNEREEQGKKNERRRKNEREEQGKNNERRRKNEREEHENEVVEQDNKAQETILSVFQKEGGCIQMKCQQELREMKCQQELREMKCQQELREMKCQQELREMKCQQELREMKCQQELRETKQSKPFQSSFLNSIPVIEAVAAGSEKSNTGSRFIMFSENEHFRELFQENQVEKALGKSLPMYIYPTYQLEPLVGSSSHGELGQNFGFLSRPSEPPPPASDNSDKLRNSMCDLVRDYGPKHEGAFKPTFLQSEALRSPQNPPNSNFNSFLEGSETYPLGMLCLSKEEQQLLGGKDFMSRSEDIKKMVAINNFGLISQSFSDRPNGEAPRKQSFKD